MLLKNQQIVLHDVGWVDVEYRLNWLNELKGLLKLPCCILQQMAIGCVEWVNPNSLPIGLTCFMGVQSVGFLATHANASSRLAANTEGFAAPLSHWFLGLGFSKTVRF